jgi:hypothetical protein
MESTTNYGLQMPEDDDQMSDVETALNDNFLILEPRADPTVIASGGALPQAGDYNLGDRVFRNDAITSGTYPSTYILVVKDATWGWHWRPVQQNISPWVTLPVGVINDALFEIHPTYPVAVAFDSQGYCHWRGAFRKKVANIPENTGYNVLKTMPVGLRTTTRLLHTVPVSPVVSGTTENGYVGGRLFMAQDGTSSFVFFNTNNATSQTFWITGLKYQPSKSFFYN